MATLAAVRTALKTRIANVSGLRVYDHFPDTLMTPGLAVVYRGPVEGAYATFSGDAYDRFSLLLAVSLAAGIDKAQTAIDEYMSKSGANSIQANLEADPPLGAVVEFALFDGWEEGAVRDINDIDYFTAIANINVWHR